MTRDPDVFGHVAIVGAGPGDPELITVRGLALLKQADVVLTDRLVPRGLLDGLRPDAEIVDVGKEPYGRATAQETIIELMTALAREGRRVVRLKGGDPFVFGRGGEEAAACRAAGIPCDVVPGVTSAVAAPAAAGIPVTHRGVTQHFTVASGHAAPGSAECTVDWGALGRDRGTLVVLMPVRHLASIVATLLAGGRPPDTPTAVISDATTGAQRVLTARLDRIVAAVERSAPRPPSMLVVGEVVCQADGWCD